MDGVDYLIAAAIGYGCVPLASLLNRRRWPSFSRFLVAVGIAAAFAVLKITAGDGPLSDETFWLTFGPLFLMMEATFKLRLPGAGSESVNERLLDVPILPD